MYLSATLQEKRLNDLNCWTMPSHMYLKASIENVERQLQKWNLKCTNKVNAPIAQGYKPELDSSENLDSDGITFYQELMGMSRWAIEIGRVDINYDVSILSSFQASPNRGHLKQMIHIFSYLCKYPKLKLYFDRSIPRIDHSIFQGSNVNEFKEMYRDSKEEFLLIVLILLVLL